MRVRNHLELPSLDQQLNLVSLAILVSGMVLIGLSCYYRTYAPKPPPQKKHPRTHIFGTYSSPSSFQVLSFGKTFTPLRLTTSGFSLLCLQILQACS